MRSPIKPDATIIDVVPTLSEPIEYVRAILSTMAACQGKHGNALVRIGITGEGKMPYHKVTYMSGDGMETVYGAYGGESAFENVEIHDRTWSSKTMNFEEVKSLLGKLRGWRG